MGTRESASTWIGAPPGSVFSVVTDVARLPEWNRALTEVVEAPEVLDSESVWKVRIHALGQDWVSRSEVSVLDPAAGRFGYRSQSDDGNPSYADWVWHVEPHEIGSIVTVAVDLNPATFWRKHLLLRVRRPSLRREMQDSLNALATVVVG